MSGLLDPSAAALGLLVPSAVPRGRPDATVVMFGQSVPSAAMPGLLEPASVPRGRPVAGCLPGPALEAALPALRRLAGRLAVCAPLRLLPRLIGAGLVPDVLCWTESRPLPWAREGLSEELVSRALLLFDPRAEAATSLDWPGPVLAARVGVDADPARYLPRALAVLVGLGARGAVLIGAGTARREASARSVPPSVTRPADQSDARPVFRSDVRTDARPVFQSDARSGRATLRNLAHGQPNPHGAA